MDEEHTASMAAMPPIIEGRVDAGPANDLDEADDPFAPPNATQIAEQTGAVDVGAGECCWYCWFLTGRFRDPGPLHVPQHIEAFFHECRRQGARLTSEALAQMLYPQWVAKVCEPLRARGVAEIEAFQMSAAKFVFCIRNETLAFHEPTLRVDRLLEQHRIADVLFQNVFTTDENGERAPNLPVVTAYSKYAALLTRDPGGDDAVPIWTEKRAARKRRR
jgi:hypothetical protein